MPKGSWKRLLALFRRRRDEREWNEEIATHLALQAEEFRARGMDEAAARNAARREFGGVQQAAEVCRDRRGIPWIETTARDLRYAARGLARNPGFTAAAVLSLALGIGANTAIFSMFHALMLRMLPVSHPEQLVTLYRTAGWGRGFCSYPFYLEVAKRSDLFSGVVARSGVNKVRFRLANGSGMETLERESVTGNYFRVLGVAPALGRLFTDSDNVTPHAHPLAILSYDFWQRRFGGDPSILGQTIAVGHDPLTIIGVAARGFHGVEVDHHADLWEPVMMAEEGLSEPGALWAWIVGRRRPEVSRSRVQAAMEVLLRQHLAAVYGNHPNAAFRKTALSQRIEVREGGVGLSLLRESFGTALQVLMLAVSLVLLAACANVANLLLARGAARRKEMALRLSLGATRGRLVRQSLAESLLLAAMGSLLAVFLAYWLERAILNFLPASAGEPFQASPDSLVLGFTMLLAALAVVLCGLGPAWRSVAVDPAACMRAGSGQTGGHESRLRKVLVVAQVAFSVMLVAMAGLFGHSLSRLRSVHLGFSRPGVVAVLVDLPGAWKADRVQGAWRALFARLEALPDISAVSFGSPGPFLGGFSNSSVRVPGSELTEREPAWVSTQRIEPRYFSILGSPPLAGREFRATDTDTAPKVAVVNQAFVRAFLPGEAQPLNRVLDFEHGKADTVAIVGVVADIPHQGLREKIAPTVYLPQAQNPAGFGAVLIESRRSREALAPSLRQAVATLGPEASGSEPRTIRERVDDSIFRDRLVATVGGFFGALALLLAGVGLYGVVAYGTVRRAKEIGIRMALGARRGAVVWMILRDALVLVSCGLVVGIPVARIAARQVAPILFDIPPDDSFTFWSTGCILAMVGLAAAILPARRAAAVEPVRVLHQE